jgi:hypothetical protein
MTLTENQRSSPIDVVAVEKALNHRDTENTEKNGRKRSRASYMMPLRGGEW